jgi:hypothetical protein
MKSDDEIIQSLIAGGVIGATLGALISKNKSEGATLGALAGVVILGMFKANEKQTTTYVPMYIEENENLYQIQPDGTKTFIRTLEKASVKVPKQFKLK